VIAGLRSLDRFGTVLLIDHTRKSNANPGDSTPFGSSAKQNHARSVLQLTGAPEGAILKQTKSSFDAPVDEIAFTMSFSPQLVTLDQIAVDDARVEEAAGVVSAMGKIQAAFDSGQFAAGASSKDVSEALEIKLKTAFNKLGLLTEKGFLTKKGHLWFRNGSESPFPVPTPLKKMGSGERGTPQDKRGIPGESVGESSGKDQEPEQPIRVQLP
jgi:hypothetical protein